MAKDQRQEIFLPEYFVYFKIFNAVWRKKIRRLAVLTFFKHALSDIYII